jgi:hypothetical protein
MNGDHEHLNLLSIFHYVVAGVAFLFACLPLLHFLFGLAMVAGWFPDMSDDPGARVFGAVIMVLAGGLILAGWTYAAATAIAGRFLGARRHYTYCLVIAAISCVFMPFGTVLGVFTIVVLVRPSVKALFGVNTGELASTAGSSQE